MKSKIAFLFPGQGAQYLQMGRSIYEYSSEARAVFEEASDIVGYSIADQIFHGQDAELTSTKICQIAIFTLSMAIEKAFHVLYPECTPYVCAGLSLGEYSALCSSKKINYVDCVSLVQARANFMHQASLKYPGSLAVCLGLEPEEVSQILAHLPEKVWIANINCPKQVVISGAHASLKKAEEFLKEKGAKRVLPIDVSGAFHSGLMKSASESLSPLIEKTPVHTSPIKLVMNVTGEIACSELVIKQHLKEQVYSTTLWEKSIHTIEKEDVDLYIELGPGKTLTGMNKKIGVKGKSFSIENTQELHDCEKLLKELF